MHQPVYLKQAAKEIELKAKLEDYKKKMLAIDSSFSANLQQTFR